MGYCQIDKTKWRRIGLARADVRICQISLRRNVLELGLTAHTSQSLLSSQFLLSLTKVSATLQLLFVLFFMFCSVTQGRLNNRYVAWVSRLFVRCRHIKSGNTAISVQKVPPALLSASRVRGAIAPCHRLNTPSYWITAFVKYIKIYFRASKFNLYIIGSF